MLVFVEFCVIFGLDFGYVNTGTYQFCYIVILLNARLLMFSSFERVLNQWILVLSYSWTLLFNLRIVPVVGTYVCVHAWLLACMYVRTCACLCVLACPCWFVRSRVCLVSLASLRVSQMHLTSIDALTRPLTCPAIAR